VERLTTGRLEGLEDRGATAATARLAPSCREVVIERRDMSWFTKPTNRADQRTAEPGTSAVGLRACWVPVLSWLKLHLADVVWKPKTYRPERVRPSCSLQSFRLDKSASDPHTRRI
jgi:hypothetical protein